MFPGNGPARRLRPALVSIIPANGPSAPLSCLPLSTVARTHNRVEDYASQFRELQNRLQDALDQTAKSSPKKPKLRETDRETDEIITMHLPSAMLPSILDAVRNEKTDIYYQIGRAFFFAKLRRAGQG